MNRSQVDALWHAHNDCTEALRRYAASRYKDAGLRAVYILAERRYYDLYRALAEAVEDVTVPAYTGGNDG